ncbi:hypothetical protein BJ912DRAFT_965973 [Pholiota molesta]|nr:hypothetical protein BJ912DRAFT_965973 [Pholiota molesta]
MSNFANLPTARMSFSETNTPRNVKTIIISVMKDGGSIEYAIAPLKTAYPEAVFTAFEALKDHLENLTPDDICLKVAAKNMSGKLIWASVAPSLWKEIVSEAVPTQVAEPSANMVEEPRPLILFKLPECAARDGYPLHMRAVAPKSYDDTRSLAFNAMKDRFIEKKSSWKDILLRGVIGEGTQEKILSFDIFISAYGTGESPEWMRLITQMKKEHPNFKILML